MNNRVNLTKTAIFIFRRDLRLEDNTALNEAFKQGYAVVPIFIFNPQQLSDHPYRSQPAIQFMVESLIELSQALVKKGSSLHLFYGDPVEVMVEVIDELNPQAIFCNRDYTPYSKNRDKLLSDLCVDKGLSFETSDDLLLVSASDCFKDDGSPYVVFTPFFKKFSKRSVPAPVPLSDENFISFQFKRSIGAESITKFISVSLRAPFATGGRASALKILDTHLPTLLQYNETRDIPSIRGTSGLSAHNKFGTVSIREVYWKARSVFDQSNRFFSELYWRDFFTIITHAFPRVFEGAFLSKFDALEWNDDDTVFRKWCNGETGFPIVDAGMRQLLQTGFMHNRVRMITASFLVKDLHIDWHKGEKFFAKNLIDYDPAVNNGSWQWAASTGCDPQPYFRIFNPWKQQERYDPKAEYVKKWIPELEGVEPKKLHNLYRNTGPLLKNYPSPIVDHSREQRIAIEEYERIQRLKVA